MAPRPDSKTDAATTTALPLGEDTVTYVPGEGDPIQVKWRGHAFRANVPKTIKNAEHLEAARGNPYLHVGPFDPAKHGQPTVVKGPPVTDGRSYRAHVVAWLKTCESAQDLVAKWAGDQKLRDLCEDIGAEDYAWLGTVIEPKLATLQLHVPPLPHARNAVRRHV